MTTLQLRRCILSLMMALVLLLAMESQQMAAGWQPNKSVEFVIMAGRGGGADKMARLMQTIIEKNRWSSKRLTLINKPGRLGAEALVHLKSKALSDPNHTIMVTQNSFYITSLLSNLGVDILTFTPIALMAEDTFLLWVHKDSGIYTVDEFVAAAKSAGSDWVMAGTGNLREDQFLTEFLNAAYGLSMTYIPYPGGGEVAKQLVGQHANSTVNNPSEQEGFYASGDTVPLAAFTPDRLEMFPNAPTFRELGQDFVYFMQRSVVGAPGMSDEAAAYYRDLFQRVYESEDWQSYRKEKGLYGDFLTGQALLNYWENQLYVHADMMGGESLRCPQYTCACSGGGCSKDCCELGGQ